MYYKLDDNRGHNISNITSFEEKLETHIKYLEHKNINTQYGKLIEKTIKNRKYIVHEHNNSMSEILGVLLFYHGSRGTGWMSALEYTRWIEYAQQNKLLIVFGQAQGEQLYPHKHPHYNDQITHGELYFEIRDNTTGFHEDIEYTQQILEDVKLNYHIDNKRVYFVGHSNGGVFGCLLTIYLPNTFRGIVSHMGGIGHDPHFYLDFPKLSNTDNKTPILFYTGEYDVHKFPCEVAYNIFKSEDFPIVDIYIEPNLDHTYCYNCEPYILNWLNNLP